MRLLLIGGTVFLGREIAAQAVTRGHQVTLFHRGKSNPDYLPAAEHLLGDRDGGLDVLAGRTWDAVIDTCGYLPRVVGAAARFLAGAVGHYTFVSTLSVYAEFGEVAATEVSPLASIDDPAVEEVTGATYGALKALCEQVVCEALDGRALVPRPGLIVGPWDPTDRFTYWPVHAAAGGRLLAPGRPAAQVQVIDVRDLSAWTLDQVEAGTVGPANVAGPVGGATMAALLQACQAAAGVDSELVWVPDAWLLARQVVPWGDLPLWYPDGDLVAKIERAVGLGLTTRPLAETARDTLAWRSAPQAAAQPLRSGLPRERLDALLADWESDCQAPCRRSSLPPTGPRRASC